MHTVVQSNFQPLTQKIFGYKYFIQHLTGDLVHHEWGHTYMGDIVGVCKNSQVCCDVEVNILFCEVSIFHIYSTLPLKGRVVLRFLPTLLDTQM